MYFFIFAGCEPLSMFKAIQVYIRKSKSCKQHWFSRWAQVRGIFRLVWIFVLFRLFVLFLFCFCCCCCCFFFVCFLFFVFCFLLFIGPQISDGLTSRLTKCSRKISVLWLKQRIYSDFNDDKSNHVRLKCVLLLPPQKNRLITDTSSLPKVSDSMSMMPRVIPYLETLDWSDAWESLMVAGRIG